jgi:hypothetical protein
VNIEGKDFIIGAVFVLVIVAAVFLTWNAKPEFVEVRYTETHIINNTIERPITINMNSTYIIQGNAEVSNES